MTSPPAIVSTMGALFAALVAGCTPSNSTADLADAAGGDAIGGDTSTDAGPGFDVGTDDSASKDSACVAVENKATVVKRPIDFIVLPDESGSMGSTRDAVADAMQSQVRKALEAAAIDYKVIWHGAWPLPALAGKVTYNKVLLGSGDDVMFKPVLDSFAAWSPALRPDAMKVFVQFTDATSGDGGSINGYTGAFDDVILSKAPALFGTSAARKFSHHVFVGVAENKPATTPYLPTDPVVGSTCGGGYSNPKPLEELARRNAGFRFPLCRPDLFGGVFASIAKGAIEAASVPCELLVPEPPAGTKLDFATVAVRFKSGGGKEEVFFRAKDSSECADNRFLLDEATRRVSLCPAACARVKADAAATLTVLSGCDPKIY